MSKKASSIELTSDQREYLETQIRARTIQAQTVCRARILLLRTGGISINDIADKVGINRCSVMLCLNKFKQGGVENALFDAPGRSRNAEITDDEKASENRFFIPAHVLRDKFKGKYLSRLDSMYPKGQLTFSPSCEGSRDSSQEGVQRYPLWQRLVPLHKRDF